MVTWMTDLQLKTNDFYSKETAHCEHAEHV